MARVGVQLVAHTTWAVEAGFHTEVDLLPVSCAEVGFDLNEAFRTTFKLGEDVVSRLKHVRALFPELGGIVGVLSRQVGAGIGN